MLTSCRFLICLLQNQLLIEFVEGIVKLHGMPKTIVSDWDPIFISKFWHEFFTLSGAQLKMSSAYHPQTDGQTEVVN